MRARLIGAGLGHFFECAWFDWAGSFCVSTEIALLDAEIAAACSVPFDFRSRALGGARRLPVSQLAGHPWQLDENDAWKLAWHSVSHRDISLVVLLGIAGFVGRTDSSA